MITGVICSLNEKEINVSFYKVKSLYCYQSDAFDTHQDRNITFFPTLLLVLPLANNGKEYLTVIENLSHFH